MYESTILGGIIMFSKAYGIASCYTQPVIISMRFFDKSIECGIGAFVVLNEEGWIVTAAHILDSHITFQKHKQEIANHEVQIESIKQDSSSPEKQKKRKLKQLKANPKWIINHSFWWSRDGVALKDIKGLLQGDFLIGRLEPFDPSWVKVYPTIKDPTKNMNPGTSVCKLGYPFHEVKATFDEPTSSFKLDPSAVPLPLFPIEGIYTRNLTAGKSKDGKYDIKFLETSSPGLRGQSGGPIFDTQGTIWAIQNKTHHFELGFRPQVKKDGKIVEENQFLSAGYGVHPELLIAFLNNHGVSFNLSNY